MRLPAAAMLTWDSPDGPTSSRYLLVPDTGGLALPALRGMLGRVAEHQAAAGTLPAMVVITTTTARRATAWAMLLETICQARRLPLLDATVATWPDLRQPARAETSRPRVRRPPTCLRWARSIARFSTWSAATPSCRRGSWRPCSIATPAGRKGDEHVWLPEACCALCPSTS